MFVYLIARGHKMALAPDGRAKANADAQRAYIQSVAGTAAGSSTAEELARLADLKEKGVITDEEFAALKAKAIG